MYRFLIISLLFILPITANANVPEKEAQKHLTSAEDAIGSVVSNYAFTDQDGKAFELKEFFGKPFIVSFIYTSCPSICPTILGNLNNAIKKTGQGFGRDFNILTISFDETNDTPERLKAYGSRFTDDFTRWRFATADKKTIEILTKEFGFYYKKQGNFFDHMNMVSIVDSKARLFSNIYGIDFKPEDVLSPLTEAIKNPDAKPVKKAFKRQWWNPFVDTVKLFCSTYNPVTKTYDFDIARLIGIIISGGTILTIFFFVWGRDIKYFVSRKFLGRLSR
ncbi:MAG: SCO family protein [Deltaproteobacteria bacterium]|nr:SCO family protein [Deltaproteobacteria bacterium]